MSQSIILFNNHSPKLIIIVITLLLSIPSLYAEQIGRAVKLRGTVKIVLHSTNTTETLLPGGSIHEKDELFVGPQGYVKILLEDDSIIQLGPESNFIFTEFSTRSEDPTIYNLLMGRMRAIFLSVEPNKELKVKTPTASMGIRGTEILSDVFYQNNLLRTEIVLLSGKMEVALPNLSTAITMKAGELIESFRPSVKKSLRMRKAILPPKILNTLISSKKQSNTFLFDLRKKNKDPKNNIKFLFKKRENTPIDLNSDKNNGLTPKTKPRINPVDDLIQNPINRNKLASPPHKNKDESKHERTVRQKINRNVKKNVKQSKIKKVNRKAAAKQIKRHRIKKHKTTTEKTIDRTDIIDRSTEIKRDDLNTGK